MSDKPKILNLVVPLDHKVFLISDSHFCHKNLIHYVGRPFKDRTEMNETMFNRWNSVVTNDDVVIFCGDFVCGTKNKVDVCNLLYRGLNGQKVMIRGNHDPVKGLSYEQYDAVFFNMYKLNFVAQHYPIDPGLMDCDVAIVGHSHSNDNPSKTMYRLENQLNVSCELLDYYPVRLTDELVDKKHWRLNTLKPTTIV